MIDLAAHNIEVILCGLPAFDFPWKPGEPANKIIALNSFYYPLPMQSLSIVTRQWLMKPMGPLAYSNDGVHPTKRK
jgi:hypothetical protein